MAKLAGIVFVAFAFNLTPNCATAADIKVLSSVVLKAALTEVLIPQFETATGNKVPADYAASARVKQRVEGGEAFDLVVLSPAGVVDDFVKSGKVAAEGHSGVGRIGVGVAIRAGASRPNIDTLDGFKRALADAKSIALVDPATGGAGAVYFMSLAQRLGIVDDIKPKLKLTPPGESAAAVAAGEAELGIGAVSEIVAVPGAELLGPFPAEVQTYTTYAAGVSAKATDPAAALALLRFINGPIGASVLKAKGIDPQ
jgi:molybdate transport system substrate-binding protein